MRGTKRASRRPRLDVEGLEGRELLSLAIAPEAPPEAPPAPWVAELLPPPSPTLFYD